MRHIFDIAGHLCVIDFLHEDEMTGIHILPSLEPFRVNGDVEALCHSGNCGISAERKPLLVLTVDMALGPLPKERRQRIREFDTGNGITIVDRLCDGGYQYVVRDIGGNDCALLISNADFSQCRCNLVGTYNARRFGLNNVIMFAYAFAGSFHQTLMVHASLVRHKGVGYAFTAKSGTGKSTQVANWLRMIPDCDLMNDDNPIVRIIDGKAIIYGSPWSGKTPCYRNISAPLGAITKICRAEENRVERLRAIKAFGVVLPSCSAMKWDHAVYTNICDTVTVLVSCVPAYVFHCTASPESAVVCKKAIT